MTRKGNVEAPQRSCLGCRVCKDKHLLLRFVQAPDNEILPDLDSRLPGRGAYTCINRNCLITAVERQQFKRSFKHEVSVMAAAELAEYVRQQLYSRIIGLTGLANKAGLVTGGGSMVIEALKSKKKPAIVLVASDTSEAIGLKIVHAAETHKVKCITIASKDDFGAILGKAPKSAIAVAAGGFVAQLHVAIDRYKNFLGEV